MDRVAVCVPTKDRPDYLRRHLMSLVEQTARPDIVLVVDSSAGDATKLVCDEIAPLLEPSVLRYESTPPGLTLQRRFGIELLRADPLVSHIAFFDDDITLEPDFFATIIGFMRSDEGRVYGGVCGYDLVDWGRRFGFAERLFHRLKIFDGELRPGRWLYCGHFLELDRLSQHDGVRPVDFLPGGLTVWRADVFDRFLPPLHMPGYALNEDKHFSLRVATAFPLAAHCGARGHHLRAPSGRPRWTRFAYNGVRAFALMIRECDPAPKWRRYFAFLGYLYLWCFAYLAGAISRRRRSDLAFALGQYLGWLSCIVSPPPREDQG